MKAKANVVKNESYVWIFFEWRKQQQQHLSVWIPLSRGLGRFRCRQSYLNQHDCPL